MISYELTGEFRYRIKHRLILPDLVVLQVEERAFGDVDYSVAGRMETDIIDNTYWRDAKLSDVEVNRVKNSS